MTNHNERRKTNQNIFQLLPLRPLLEGSLPSWRALLACTCASRIAEETLLKGYQSLTGVRMCQQSISDAALKTRHSGICFDSWAERSFTEDYYLLSDVVKNGSINSVGRICTNHEKKNQTYLDCPINVLLLSIPVVPWFRFRLIPIRKLHHWFHHC